MRSEVRVGVLALVVASLLTRTEVDCKPTTEKADLKNETETETEAGETGVQAKDLKYTFANEGKGYRHAL